MVATVSRIVLYREVVHLLQIVLRFGMSLAPLVVFLDHCHLETVVQLQLLVEVLVCERIVFGG